MSEHVNSLGSNPPFTVMISHVHVYYEIISIDVHCTVCEADTKFSGKQPAQFYKLDAHNFSGPTLPQYIAF